MAATVPAMAGAQAETVAELKYYEMAGERRRGGRAAEDHRGRITGRGPMRMLAGLWTVRRGDAVEGDGIEKRWDTSRWRLF